MSSLPTLDDLHSKARLSRDVYRNPYLTLDLRYTHNTAGQAFSNCPQQPVLITPEQDAQNARRSFFRNCTAAFQCSRLKPGLPAYRPIHRQISSPLSPSSRILAHWKQWTTVRQACFLTTLICTAAAVFCFGVFLVTTATTSTTSNIIHRDSESHHWYKDALFYEIFPASFQDTDSDGYGDFQGIIQRLDYIHNLGVNAIRLSSIFSALDYPLEYEHIIDLHSADPHLGRMDDFRQLVRESHKRGIRVVLDLNPTVTSDQHTWALHWERGIPGYEHFYASHNRSKAPPEMESTDGPPPEDWELPQRTFGGHYVVNWSNSFVQKEYQKAISRWVDAGIDGIYMKHLDKLHLLNIQDVISIIRQWRTELDKHSYGYTNHKHISKRVLIVSSRFVDNLANISKQRSLRSEILKYVDIVDFPILLTKGMQISNHISSIRKVSVWPKTSPVAMWHLGSSETFRLASRLDERFSMAAFLLLLTLPGAGSVFYGDEFGLKNSIDNYSGRVYRGGQLTPMQWTSDNLTCGFTDNLTNPWLPLTVDHYSTNVQNQVTHLQEFTRMVDFRKTVLKSYKNREQRVDVLEPNVIVLERTHHRLNSKRILFAANFGNTSEDKEFPEAYGNVKAILETALPTRTRVRSRGFTLSPGAAFVAEVRLMYYPSPTVVIY